MCTGKTEKEYIRQRKDHSVSADFVADQQGNYNLKYAIQPGNQTYAFQGRLNVLEYVVVFVTRIAPRSSQSRLTGKLLVGKYVKVRTHFKV